ncbi:MAG TPA: NFACT RNA binding domain-containing protein [Candidatus Aquilonibacter sp.]
MASLRTDPELIARLAAEIDARLGGARVRDVGRLADGRTAIVLWKRGTEATLCIDVFATPPLVTVEDVELPIESEPGFIRAAGAALRGSTLLAARARKGDRLLRLTFGTRSRFGVGDESDLFIELVPRFGNIVLVRKERIVAAAKEFSLADNPARAIEAGQPYALPPLRPRAANVESATPVPETSVLDMMRDFRATTATAGAARKSDDRRKSIQKRLAERERKVHGELAAVAAKQRAASDRETLRERGDALYAELHTLDPDAQDAAKEEARALFARYKKLGTSSEHLAARERTLRTMLEAVEQLRWESERVEDSDLADLEHALSQLDPRAQRKRTTLRRRKRAPLEVRTPGGSRILVGRSPSENADLTFRVARPNDWWFHAQGVPGAHVILQRDDRDEPPAEDLERAAALAAYFSKARASGKVTIDYTLRKYVRAQRDAPPGLVWYTNPKTIIVEPAAP